MDYFSSKHWSNCPMTLWYKLALAALIIPWEIPVMIAIATFFI